jgi:putative ABC transport system permease protein
VICITVVTGTLFTTSILITGVNQSIVAQTGKLGSDIIVTRQGYTTPIEKILLTGQIDVNEVDRYLIESSLEEEIKAIQGVENITPQLYMATLTEASCCAVWSVLLVGFDPETDFIVKPWLKTELKTPLESDDILQGTHLRLPVGGETIFYGHLFKIKGELEPTGTGTDMAVYMPLAGAYEMAADSYITAEKPLPIEEGQVSAFFIKVAPEYGIEDVALMINIKVEGVDTITSTTAGQTVRSQVSSLLQTFLLTDGILWGMSALLIAAIFSMVVSERRREIGLLRAMGATKNYVFKIIMLEAITLALIGGIAGIVAGGAIVYFLEGFIATALNIPYIQPTLTTIGSLIGIAIGLAAAIGVLAAVYPASRISRIDPYDAVRSGEL